MARTDASNVSAIAWRARSLALTIAIAAAMTWVLAPMASAAPPANDDFEDAQVLNGPVAVVAGDTREATREATVDVTEPDHNDAGGQASVWYQITPSVDGAIEVDVCDSNFPTAIAAYAGTEESTLGDLTQVEASLCEIDFPVCCGQIFWIAVDGDAGLPPGRGTFTLRLQEWEAPENDFELTPEIVTGSAVNIDGDNRGATSGLSEPNISFEHNASVWYRWTAPALITGAQIEISDCDQHRVGVFRVTNLGDPWGSDTSVGVHTCEAHYAITAGATYWIGVDGPRGTFNLRIDGFQPPGNDNFANATALPNGVTPTGSTATATGDTRGATREQFEPGSGQTTSVWYSWEAPFSGGLELDVCTDDSLVNSTIYTGPSVGELTPVNSFSACLIRIPISLGVHYRIAVTNVTSNSHTFDLQLHAYQKPANDDFADAVLLSGSEATASGDTRGASRQNASGEPLHQPFSNPLDGSVWYRWVAAGTGRVRIDVCPSTVDFEETFRVAGYTDPPPVAGSPQFSDLVQQATGVCVATFRVTSGTTYFVAVEGRVGDRGSFALRLRNSTGTPANDDVVNATPLSGNSGTINGSSAGATYEQLEPALTSSPLPEGGSVWFSFLAQRSGRITVSTCDSAANFDTTVAVFLGDQLPDLTLLGRDDDGGSCGQGSRVEVQVAANTHYKIAIDGDLSNSDISQWRGAYKLTYAFVDDVGPDTEITTSEPTSVLTERQFLVAFRSPDEVDSTFQCSLDFAAFTTCTNPRTLTGLTDGEHTFQVRAVDPSLNVDTSPAEVTFTVDASPPQTSITHSPGDRTTDSTPTFGYRSSEENSSFECRIDSAPFVPCNGVSILEGADAEFTPVALGDGPHRFEVKSSDEHGNVDDTVAAREFTVDATPPVVTIDSGPADVRDQTPTFRYSASEPGAEFSCRIDAGPAFPCSDPSSDAASQAELTTIALADGNRTFEVRATDASGNRGEFVMLAFRIDRNAASADGSVAPETVLDKKPKARLVTRGVTKKLGFTFSSPTAGAMFECAIQRKKRRKASLAPPSFGPCTSPKTYKKKPGIYRFSVRAVSGGLPDETPATYTLTILQPAAP